MEHFPDAPTSWGAQIGALLGVGGAGAIILKLIERIFARADRGDDVAAGLRAEMIRRIETLERQYATLERRERESYQKAIRLEAENRQLRQRYHNLINWIAGTPGLPQPPAWLYEPVEGPTDDESLRRRAAEDQP